jgi:hypothetical protein
LGQRQVSDVGKFGTMAAWPCWQLQNVINCLDELTRNCLIVHISTWRAGCLVEASLESCWQEKGEMSIREWHSESDRSYKMKMKTRMRMRMKMDEDGV